MNKSSGLGHGGRSFGVNAIARWACRNRGRLAMAWFAGQCVALSGLHHLANLWEAEASSQLAAAASFGLVCAVGIALALAPIWAECESWPRRTWLAMLVPAMLLSAGLAAEISRTPEANHQLVIQPATDSDGGVVSIREIRLAPGNAIDLSGLELATGWRRQGNLLTTDQRSAVPVEIDFWGPVGDQVRVSFITSTTGGTVTVTVDHHTVALDLAGPEGNETRARLRAGYRWGTIDSLFLPFLLVVDALAILVMLGLLWIMHRLGVSAHAGMSSPAGSRDRRRLSGLALICVLAVVLHGVSFFSAPLRVTKDGPSYLQGAVHLMEHHNLDGAASYRGPGTTFLFAPALLLFERNPVGVKLTLHTLAIACVPLAYAIGWQLTRRRWIAGAMALLAAVSPDLYAYASDVLSEVPHIFSLLLYCSALLWALGKPSFWRLLSCLLTGALAVLVRPDNAAALGIGTIVLAMSTLGSKSLGEPSHAPLKNIHRTRLHLILAGLVAAVPLLGWSAHNLRVHGFFGISNYLGEVLYDGWIFFGENSDILILDRDSRAVKTIDAVIPITPQNQECPTGWTVYYALLEQGVTGNAAFSLLGRASIDSIRRHPDRAMEILLLKLRTAAIPEATLPISTAGQPSADPYAELTQQYFDPEPWLLPSRYALEAWTRSLLQLVYRPFYAFWLAMGFLGLWLAFYRGARLDWLGYVAVAVNVLFLPTVIGVANWRYVLPGLFLVQPLALAVIDAFITFVPLYARRWANAASGLSR